MRSSASRQPAAARDVDGQLAAGILAEVVQHQIVSPVGRVFHRFQRAAGLYQGRVHIVRRIARQGNRLNHLGSDSMDGYPDRQPPLQRVPGAQQVRAIVQVAGLIRQRSGLSRQIGQLLQMQPRRFIAQGRHVV